MEGELVGERVTGGTRTDHLTDALGSVTATVDASANLVSTYRAKPYGARLAKTGSGADPRFEWTGRTGSRREGLAYAEQYNVRRHLGARQGAWKSVDFLSSWGERLRHWAQIQPQRHK